MLKCADLKHIKDKYPNTAFQIESKRVKLSGPTKGEVAEVAAEIEDIINRVKVTKQERAGIPESVCKMLKTPEIEEYLDQIYRGKSLKPVLQVKTNSVAVYGNIPIEAKKAMYLLIQEVIEKRVAIPDGCGVLDRQEWKDKMDLYRIKWSMVNVVVDRKAGDIVIAGRREHVKDANDDVCDFLHKKTIKSALITSDTNRVKVLQRAFDLEISQLEDEYTRGFARVLFPPDGSTVKVSGSEDTIQKLQKKIKLLLSQVKKSEFNLTDPNMSRCFVGIPCDIFIAATEQRCKVAIEAVRQRCMIKRTQSSGIFTL